MAMAGAVMAVQMETAVEQRARLVRAVVAAARGIAPNASASVWQSDGVSLAAAFALLWQDDEHGGEVSGRKGDVEAHMTMMAAVALDLLLRGRAVLAVVDDAVGLKWRSWKEYHLVLSAEEAARHQAQAATPPAGGDAPEAYLDTVAAWIAKQKHARVSLKTFFLHFVDGPMRRSAKIVDAVFGDLCDSGVLSEQSSRALGFLWTSKKFPTRNPDPEEHIVSDIRRLVEQSERAHEFPLFTRILFLLARENNHGSFDPLKRVFPPAARKQMHDFTDRCAQAWAVEIKKNMPMNGAADEYKMLAAVPK